MEKLTRNSYPGILCGIVILILTGLPGSFLPKAKPALGLDKIAHIIMFAGFAFACLWGYRDSFPKLEKPRRRKMLFRTALIATTFGGLTEIMQETICYQRTGSYYDFLADIIGTALGLLVFSIFFDKENKIDKSRVL